MKLSYDKLQRNQCAMVYTDFWARATEQASSSCWEGNRQD